ncbi:hypothetical protein BH10PAT2_BH10PAT2_3050 [soil metagenome]
MTENEQRPTLANFATQMERIRTIQLLSLGHQENAAREHDIRYAFLQEISNRLAAIKMAKELDPQTEYLSLAQLNELDALIEQKVAELEIKPEELTQSTEYKDSTVAKQSIGPDRIGSTLRKIRLTLNQLRASFT